MRRLEARGAQEADPVNQVHRAEAATVHLGLSIRITFPQTSIVLVEQFAADKECPPGLLNNRKMTMDTMFVRIGFLFISAVCIVWGGLITFSDKYFTYWQNTYWKEKNNNQWSDPSRKANRLGAGFGALVFGIALAYMVLFEMH
jgi:hypothetical protein